MIEITGAENRRHINLPFLPRFLIKLILVFIVGTGYFNSLPAADKFLIVIIDGARYTETFGDPNHTYIPRMWNLSSQGTYLTHFNNDSLTYTSRAIPALWCGSWTGVRDTTYNGISTQYTQKPSLFEYFRQQKNLPEEECFYVLKHISSLWLPSFHPGYGPQNWPRFHSQGFSDEQVADQAKYVLDQYHPHFMLVYLADVDGAGHSGNWSGYVNAIETADSIVADLWNYTQADTFYQNSTYLFVTNDHGRHDNQHGGFSGHGDGCEGCRHIMFLALGPDIRQNHVSHQYRRIPDMAVTAGEILGLNLEYATGQVMTELLQTNRVRENKLNQQMSTFSLRQNSPNPFNPVTTIRFYLPESAPVKIAVYNVRGQRVAVLADKYLAAGPHAVRWDAAGRASGLYFYRLQAPGFDEMRKMLLVR